MKRYTVLLIIAFLAIVSYADNVAQQINDIKRDAENYIFAESTVKSEDEARHNADGLLVSYINDYLEETAPGTKFSPAMAAKFQYLTMKRGSGIRVFAYINKSVLTGGQPQKTVKTQREKDEAEMQHTSYHSTSTVSTPVPQSSSLIKQQGNTSVEQIEGSYALTSSQQDVIKDLIEARDMESAMKLLAMFKVMRKVKDYGTLNNVTNKNECFWIIGDSDFKVNTILSPGMSRTNFATGSTDNLENHRGVPVLWFKMN